MLDAYPVVTRDSSTRDMLRVRMPTEEGVYEFLMEAEKADRLRYLLGRALDSADEPPNNLARRNHPGYSNPPSTDPRT